MSASAPEGGTPVEGLLGPTDVAYRLELTEAELKVVHTALKALFDGLGHDEDDVKGIVAEVLAKLPDEHAIRAIDLGRELARRRADMLARRHGGAAASE